MAETHVIKQGDTLPVMDVTLYRDKAHTQPVDLTAANAVTLKVGTPGANQLLLDTIMETVTAAEGRVRYQFKLSDWEQIDPGTFSMEIEVEWTNGDVSTYPKEGYATLQVEQDLDP